MNDTGTVPVLRRQSIETNGPPPLLRTGSIIDRHARSRTNASSQASALAQCISMDRLAECIEQFARRRIALAPIFRMPLIPDHISLHIDHRDGFDNAVIDPLSRGLAGVFRDVGIRIHKCWCSSDTRALSWLQDDRHLRRPRLPHPSIPLPHRQSPQCSMGRDQIAICRRGGEVRACSLA